MKTIPAARHTREDSAIFKARLRAGQWPFCAYLEFSAREADRRDAALLLAWRRFRRTGVRKSMETSNLWWLRDASEPRWQPVGGQL